MRNRKRMRFGIAVVATALALNAALWLATAGFGLPQSLGDYFFGPRLVRAEVVLIGGNGVRHDYFVDRGRLKAIAPGTLTLVERDGTVVVIPVAPNAKVQVDSAPAGFAALRRKMTVIAVRDGEDAPADTIRAFRPRGRG